MSSCWYNLNEKLPEEGCRVVVCLRDEDKGQTDYAVAVYSELYDNFTPTGVEVASRFLESEEVVELSGNVIAWRYIS